MTVHGNAAIYAEERETLHHALDTSRVAVVDLVVKMHGSVSSTHPGDTMEIMAIGQSTTIITLRDGRNSRH
jgi:hypothetical protein